MEEAGAGEDRIEKETPDPLGLLFLLLLLHDPAPHGDDHPGEIDLSRAGIDTGPTEETRLRRNARRLPAVVKRRDHGPDHPGVDMTEHMPAYDPVRRTDVGAGGTTEQGQGPPAFVI